MIVPPDSVFVLRKTSERRRREGAKTINPGLKPGAKDSWHSNNRELFCDTALCNSKYSTDTCNRILRKQP